MARKRHIPERTCCGCFQKKPSIDLIPVTKLKNGIINVNPEGIFFGRSAYLCRKMDCLKKARERKGRNGLEYALKAKIPSDLWLQLEKLIK